MQDQICYANITSILARSYGSLLNNGYKEHNVKRGLTYRVATITPIANNMKLVH